MIEKLPTPENPMGRLHPVEVDEVITKLNEVIDAVNEIYAAIDVLSDWVRRIDPNPPSEGQGPPGVPYAGGAEP